MYYSNQCPAVNNTFSERTDILVRVMSAKNKNKAGGAGEMAQRLRVSAVYPEDPSLDLSTHTGASQLPLTTAPRVTLFWPHRHLHTCDTHTHINKKLKYKTNKSKAGMKSISKSENVEIFEDMQVLKYRKYEHFQGY